MYHNYVFLIPAFTGHLVCQKGVKLLQIPQTPKLSLYYCRKILRQRLCGYKGGCCSCSKMALTFTTVASVRVVAAVEDVNVSMA